MTHPDLSFTIRQIRTAHLAFPDTPGYWEQYRRQNEAGSKTPSLARYEFKPGWQTVYATMVETPLVRVELADLYTGWGESNTPIAPEIVCVIIDAAIAEMVSTANSLPQPNSGISSTTPNAAAASTPDTGWTHSPQSTSPSGTP